MKSGEDKRGSLRAAIIGAGGGGVGSVREGVQNGAISCILEP